MSVSLPSAACIFTALLALLVPAARPSEPSFWVSGYYVDPSAWHHRFPMSPGDIDFSTVTHVLHYAVRVRPDGSLDLQHYCLAASAKAVVQAAHGAGRKVLVTIGHAKSAPGFRVATADGRRAEFVASILRLVRTNGYDGADIDWEPLEPADSAPFAAFVHDLEAALQKLPEHGLLTIEGTAKAIPAIAPVQAAFDRINIMSYDLAWPDAKITWHNSALFNRGHRDPRWGAPLRSVNEIVRKYVSAGLTKGKLSVGIPFYGYVWRNVAAPAEPYPSEAPFQAVDYNVLVSSRYAGAQRHWDPEARVPFLTLPGAAGPAFVSFDDERSVAEKTRYARQSGLGGVMVWELTAGYVGNNPAPRRNPLLTAIRDALNSRVPQAPNLRE